MEIKDVFSLKIIDIFSLMASIPITIYVNFKCLPIKAAIKLPLFVGYKTRIDKLSRNIEFGCTPKTFMVRIGWGGTEGRECEKKNYLLLNKNASIKFNGRCTMSSGVSLSLDNGRLEIGDNFFCDKISEKMNKNNIIIGDDVLVGWNVELLDSDNHQIVHRKKTDNSTQGKIFIGNHVWLSAYTHVLKNSSIPDGSVVSYHSIVTRQFSGEKLLIGGYPAKVISDCVEWER